MHPEHMPASNTLIFSKIPGSRTHPVKGHGISKRKKPGRTSARGEAYRVLTTSFLTATTLIFTTVIAIGSKSYSFKLPNFEDPFHKGKWLKSRYDLESPRSQLQLARWSILGRKAYLIKNALSDAHRNIKSERSNKSCIQNWILNPVPWVQSDMQVYLEILSLTTLYPEINVLNWSQVNHRNSTVLPLIRVFREEKYVVYLE